MPGAPHPRATRERAVSLYLSGSSMNAVSKAVGATDMTVRRWLDDAGVAIRGERVSYPESVRQQALHLYTVERLSARKVAGRLGLKVFTVKEWVSAASIIRGMSESAAISITNGDRRGASVGRLHHESDKSSGGVTADSRFEIARMIQHDNDQDVIRWSRCSFYVPYRDKSGRSRNYVPDLVVERSDGSITVEEVKLKKHANERINQSKFDAARAYCASRGWGFAVICF